MELLEARAMLAAAPAGGAEQRVEYEAPIVIRQAGTYSGNWQSLDPDVAAVTIETDQPVIISNSTIRSRGDLIESEFHGADITIVNTRGYGMNPNVRGNVAGRFLEAEFFSRVTVKNNYLRGTSGILLYDFEGDPAEEESIRIVKNRARNIDGRKSDGDGGYLAFNTRVRMRDGLSEDGFARVQFVQFNQVHDAAGAEIAWNYVVNEPGKSRVEDNISIFDSSGTRAAPIRIHDNFIQGAYTIKPEQTDFTKGNWRYTWDYSGGGIMLGDGTDPAFVRAYRNQVVSTTNYGIAIYAGHDNYFYDNRVISSGRLSDGGKITAQNVGVFIWDGHDAGSDLFYSNRARDNRIGWMNHEGRNDWWIPDADNFTDNRPIPGTITLATEKSEESAWQEKLSAEDILVGPTR